MQAYSLDLRKRIVEAVKSGERINDVAERYKVSRWTVQDYMKLDKAGKLEPVKHPGQPRQLQGEDLESLKQQVKEHPDWTLEQRATALALETGIELKKSAISSYLKRLGITYKKRASSLQSEMSSSVKLTVLTPKS